MSGKTKQAMRKSSLDLDPGQTPQHILRPMHLSRQHSKSQRFVTSRQANLTEFEKTEVQKYQNVYFYGNIESKQVSATDVSEFDDRQKHYLARVGDHIAYRFEILEIIGRGVFGQVLRCFDHKRQREVALKILANTRDMKEQGVLEAEVVRKLTKDPDPGSEFVAKSRGSFLFRDHICIEFELLGMNLHEFRKMKGGLPLQMTQIRSIGRNILSGLAFCHRNQIVHCDLKPENIVFTRHSFDKVKIIDFGSTCYDGLQKYGYVQSRFYRAPEVMIGARYGAPIDMWSFGCILVELATGRPLFSGRSEEEHMKQMLEVLGVPKKSVIEQGSRWTKFFDKDGNPLDAKVVRNVPVTNSLEMVTRITDTVFLSLVADCLEWDPAERIKAEDALRHPFFSKCESPKSPKRVLEFSDMEWR